MTQKYSATTWANYMDNQTLSAWQTIEDDITFAGAAKRFVQIGFPELEDNHGILVAVFNHDMPKNVCKIKVVKKVMYETLCYRGEEANRDEPETGKHYKAVEAFNNAVDAFVAAADAIAGGER